MIVRAPYYMANCESLARTSHVTGHNSVGTEDSVRSLLVQLVGGYDSGFPGCKWGTGLTYL